MAEKNLVGCHPGSYFVTGTDTGVGKTLVAAGLLVAASQRGLRSVGIKPVAAGCTSGSGAGLVSEDALALQQAASVKLGYVDVNPVALELPIAPHLAAANSGVRLGVSNLVQHCRQVAEDSAAEFIVVEGAGGWLVPLNASETMADFCVELGYPVIIVVGMKLGCLNHALLTMHAVQAAGLLVAGWVANCTEPQMMAMEGNLQTLRDLISAPLLGVVPYLGPSASADQAAENLQLDQLAGVGT